MREFAAPAIDRVEASPLRPQLDGDAAKAVLHEGSHMQIVAVAGSGKTEVVAQRLARLVADGEDPRSIVALTFNVAAAEELRQRVRARVASQHASAVDAVFVGTLHSFAHTLLRRAGQMSSDVSLLNEGRLVAFLASESNRLGLDNLGSNTYSAIDDFLASLEVVENELLADDALVGSFAMAVHRFRAACRETGATTYGQLISDAVGLLEDPTARFELLGDIRHVIVDEYQDINPAQERLLELTVETGAQLCVVGDDDQSIYGWRGADVRNIVGFAHRYAPCTRFALDANRRSVPEIVEAAGRFAATIPHRVDKQLTGTRSATANPALLGWTERDRESEAARVREFIQRLAASGLQWGQIAVLGRSRAALDATRATLVDAAIPIATPGRQTLFTAPLAQALGRTVALLAERSWRSDRGVRPERQTIESVALQYLADTDSSNAAPIEEALHTWIDGVSRGEAAPRERFAAMLSLTFDPPGPEGVESAARTAQVGAALDALLAEFESGQSLRLTSSGSRKAIRYDRAYYRRLWAFLQHWAATQAHETVEAAPVADGVHLGTVHGAKGLEWPAVFLVGCTSAAFPSSFTGRPRDWLLPVDRFDHERYEGTDADERRLFYVAMTRARDFLSISAPLAAGKRKVKPSPYLEDILGGVALSGGAEPSHHCTSPPQLVGEAR